MRIIGSIALLVGLAMTAGAAESVAPTDAQIASIVVTANPVDIDAGKLAVRKTHRKDVRAFAQLMISDHTGVNNSAMDLVTRLHMAPEAGPISGHLQTDGDKNEYHQHVLATINELLIPSASNAELKALLVQVEPAFVGHLKHAKRIQATLADKG
jgi:putative membrane protein